MSRGKASAPATAGVLVHPAAGAIRASRAPAVALPGGRVLMTPMDAGNYIAKLPEAEHTAEEWQAAMEAFLMLVVTLGGPTMFARIGVMMALNRHVERVFDSSRKDHHWGRRKLARDR